MKSLTISLIIVLFSILGIKATSEVSNNQAREEGRIQFVKAEIQFDITNEAELNEMNVSSNDLNNMEMKKYVPAEFQFLNEEENDNLFYRLIFDIFLSK